MHSGRSHQGDSVQKRARERKRLEKRLEKERRRGGLSVGSTGIKKPKPVDIKLRRLGRRKFFPTITAEAWVKLRKGEHATVGRFSYVIDFEHTKAGEIIVFSVIKNVQVRNESRTFGKFKISIENETIERIQGEF